VPCAAPEATKTSDPAKIRTGSRPPRPSSDPGLKKGNREATRPVRCRPARSRQALRVKGTGGRSQSSASAVSVCPAAAEGRRSQRHPVASRPLPACPEIFVCRGRMRQPGKTNRLPTHARSGAGQPAAGSGESRRRKNGRGKRFLFRRSQVRSRLDWLPARVRRSRASTTTDSQVK
jgi:hypothetical protein